MLYERWLILMHTFVPQFSIVKARPFFKTKTQLKAHESSAKLKWDDSKRLNYHYHFNSIYSSLITDLKVEELCQFDSDDISWCYKSSQIMAHETERRGCSLLNVTPLSVGPGSGAADAYAARAVWLIRPNSAKCCWTSTSTTVSCVVLRNIK